MRFSSQDFWHLTPAEFFAAIDGYLEEKGVSKDSSTAPMTRSEMNKLFDNIEKQRNNP